MRRNHLRHRKGMALFIAVTLLTLGAALLVGTSAAGRAAMKAQVSAEGSLRAGAESRRVMAGVVQSWSAANDALAIGSTNSASITHESLKSQIRIVRVSAARFAVVVDTQFGRDDAVIARRRLQIVLERPSSPDSSGTLVPPRPIGQWAVSDIY